MFTLIFDVKATKVAQNTEGALFVATKLREFCNVVITNLNNKKNQFNQLLKSV